MNETSVSSISTRGGRGGEGWGNSPLYKPYRYVSPERVKFLQRFSKTVVDFAHFVLWIGYSFLGSYGGVWTYLSIDSIVNE